MRHSAPDRTVVHCNVKDVLYHLLHLSAGFSRVLFDMSGFKATWALLPTNDQIPASEAVNMLGRIVANPRYPLGDYAPESLPTLPEGTNQLVEIEDEDVDIVLRCITDSSLLVRLSRLLKGRSTERADHSDKFESKRVVTRTLRLHRKIWKEQRKAHATEIETLMKEKSDRGHNLYMIVGVKTGLRTSVADVKNMLTSVGGQATISPEDAFLQLGLPVGDAFDLSIEARAERLRSALTRYVAQGERIFALQYRIISRKRDLAFRTTLAYGHVLEGPRAQGYFAGNDHDDDNDDDDDDDDDDDGEEAPVADDKLALSRLLNAAESEVKSNIDGLDFAGL